MFRSTDFLFLFWEFSLAAIGRLLLDGRTTNKRDKRKEGRPKGSGMRGGPNSIPRRPKQRQQQTNRWGGKGNTHTHKRVRLVDGCAVCAVPLPSVVRNLRLEICVSKLASQNLRLETCVSKLASRNLRLEKKNFFCYILPRRRWASSAESVKY
jgi:hypothetical protein